MTVLGMLEIVVFFALVVAVAKPVGAYLHWVYSHQRSFPVERAIYRIAGIDPGREMRWTTYAVALLAFNLVGFGALYLVLLGQRYLPLNPQHLPSVGPYLAFNTAVSFMTNTNWQAYAGEVTLSYASQLALVVQQMLSPLTGICLLLVLIRGFTRQRSETVGNFWVDLVRGFVWVILPGSFAAAIILVALGSPQNFLAYLHVHTLSGARQTIAQGPVASMTGAMQFGDNGGGFFNANAGHPYEAPTAASGGGSDITFS